MCNEPLEIYNHMYSQSIGSRVSDFYLAWAWELEQTGNMKKANSVLQEAVTCGAQPHDRLMQGQRSVCRVRGHMQADWVRGQDDKNKICPQSG